MKKIALLFFVIITCPIAGQSNYKEVDFINNLFSLNFERLNEIAPELDKGVDLPYFSFMKQIVYNSGQKPKKDKKIYDQLKEAKLRNNLLLYNLTLGMYHLYNNTSNEQTFKFLTNSLIHAKQNKEIKWQKITLFFFLELYSQEIVQSSDTHLYYLKEFKSLIKNDTEQFWFHIYNIKLISKRNKGDDTIKQFEKAFINLQKHFQKKKYNDNLSSYYKYFDGLRHQLQGDIHNAIINYQKVVELTEKKSFLKYLKFSSLIQKSQLFSINNNFSKSKSNLEKAKKEWNISDTIRSRFIQKKYTAINYFEPLKKYDSAYIYLKESIRDEQKLDFRKNTIKISELNVRLQTSEKENEIIQNEKKIVQLLNTNLKTETSRIRNKNLLIGSIVFIIIGIIIALLIYKNTKRKQRIAEQEREIQIQKTEKLLKEQELAAIDAMISGQEKERQRLANELHDNLGSTLATVKLHFQHLQNNRDNPKVEHVEELYTKTNALLDEAYQKVRTIAHEKNSGVMANQGLLPAIKNLAKQVSNGDGLHIEIQDYGLEERLDNTLEISIFRMIQELITNTIKHAEASEIHISLTNHDSLLNIIIEDNGKGFDAKILPKKEGMGLRNIEKRVEHLEGTFEIDSTIGKGTNIIINIPI
ncbi:sensor histidine kinase [Aquimarina megaterium]|uniref:sensor histidine kinase n=1 Tax=Aquimarina megaterium TaxID=1443666 RepID=UPI0004700306|nr:sensor histidine kinase [Aquimarina megaterium]